MANEDPDYLAWVRSFPCAVCRRRPTTAHHHTGGRGLGQRAHDHKTIALCFVCHDDFHQARGFFRGMAKRERREWQDDQVKRMREFWERKNGQNVVQLRREDPEDEPF